MLCWLLLYKEEGQLRAHMYPSPLTSLPCDPPAPSPWSPELSAYAAQRLPTAVCFTRGSVCLSGPSSQITRPPLVSACQFCTSSSPVQPHR